MAFVPITNEEQKYIAQFRKRISDLSQDEIEDHETCIVAWLRAREYDLDKAESMIRKSKEFLRESGYDTILSWDPPKHYELCFPYELSGYDRNGYPVIIMPVCEWDSYARKELAAGRKDIVNKFVLQLCAKIMQDVKSRSNVAENVVLTKYTLIFDLRELKLHHLTTPALQEFLLPNFRLCERNFPESLSTVFVVNAPKIFAVLFPLIKPVLAPKVLGKIQLFDSNSEKWKEQLLKFIPKESLPIYFGGTRPDYLQQKVEDLHNMEDDNTIGVGGVSVDSLKEVTIKAGEKLVLDFEIKDDGSTINWIFQTAKYDIGFSLIYNNNEVVMPTKRIYSQESVQEGSFICDKLGTYSIIFDNTFSMFRAKTVHYLVVVEK